MDIGASIKGIRKEKGISQEILSLESNISRSHMYKIEANKSSPTISLLEKIAAVLGVKVSEIVSKAEDFF